MTRDTDAVDRELARGRIAETTPADLCALIGTERPTNPSDNGERPIPRSPAGRSDPEVCELLYELLDAHADTACLATAHEDDERWAAHLDYLRGLQRVGRQFLAGLAAQPMNGRTAPARGSA